MKKYKLTKERHGMRRTRLYSIWCGIKNRCFCVTSKDYHNYGAKGISVDEKWFRFTNFMRDMLDSYNDHVEKFGEINTTIDRIDFKGNYSKDNCRWATKKEQSINKSHGYLKIKRDKNGRFTLDEIAKKFNVNVKNLKVKK